jgi:hypothetical protein
MNEEGGTPIVEDVTTEVYSHGMNALRANIAEKGELAYYHGLAHKKDPNAPPDQFAGGPVTMSQAKLNSDAVVNRGYAKIDHMESMEGLLQRYQNHRRQERDRMQGAANAVCVTTYSWADVEPKDPDTQLPGGGYNKSTRVKVYIPLDKIEGGVDCTNARLRFTARRCILNFEAGGKTHFLRLNLDSGNCNSGKVKDIKLKVKTTGTSNPKIILTIFKLVPGSWARLTRDDNIEWEGEPEPADFDDGAGPADPNEDRQLQYKRGEQLGGRDVSKVFQVTHIETEKEFVAKVISCPEMEEAGFAYTEARIMRQLKGNQFVGFEDCFTASEKGTGAFTVHIIMEHCADGDMASHLAALPEGVNSMDQDAIGHMLTPVLDGIRLMHAKGWSCVLVCRLCVP